MTTPDIVPDIAAAAAAAGLACTALSLRRRGRAILSDVTLSLRQGELVCLVGPNGAGKSSLIRCLDGLWRPGGGTVAVEGRPLHSLSREAVARLIAYVPQAAGETMALSVAEMVALGRAPHRHRESATERAGRVAAALARFGLGAMAERAFDELSGGERQRVLLARAFVQDARYLLLDEPTSALDLRHQLDALQIVRGLVDELGVGVMVAIHDLAAAARFADRIVLLSAGQVQTEGAWQDVLTPDHIRTAFGVEVTVGSADGLPYIIPAAVA
ncbi:ABC transporter ATP-binding protein [Sphingobium sufflavum]|uniref:ABC transporter ATP-binding protein n=1 Tax=Sphingobium sufflavum TaxID=1129547 RepID=UPI001F41454B|nr:ABC transporter ATP-binding protein [Sphingobium sufflavum]MCE7796185.1 ABC transporter ATP-binding protein [Sphingobium sufflavum]